VPVSTPVLAAGQPQAALSEHTRRQDGRPDLAGEDFAHLAADGRIQLLVSFDGTPAEPRE
jgi:hypothetical protein